MGAWLAEEEAQPLRAAEFFAGIGLVREALTPLGVHVVWANDIEKAKLDIYANNHDASDFHLGDIREVTAKDLPSHLDLATSSFPCVDLSLAGNRRGLVGEQSGMFWEFARVLTELGDARPRALLLENVIGFASSHNGKDLADALSMLFSLGYSCDVFTVDARHFVPQSRPRMFIVALRGEPLDRVLRGVPPLSDVRPEWVRRIYRQHQSVAMHYLPLPALPAGPKDLSELVEPLEATDLRWWDAARLQAFIDSLSERQSARAQELKDTPGLSWRTAYRRTRSGVSTWEIRPDAIAGCLRTTGGGSSRQALVEAGNGHLRVRWMTPVEYARLMGAGSYIVRATTPNQALFGFGDAVAVDVVRWIGQHYLLPVLRPSAATTPHTKEKSSKASKATTQMTSRRTIDMATTALPREVKLIRESISRVLRQPDPQRPSQTIGRAKAGVYAFYDYDDEPIYVGQTAESFSSRLGRHLTGQRSDAVAKYVLDPFEVRKVSMWSFPEIGDLPSKLRKAALDPYEYAVYRQLLTGSRFQAVLNEGNIPFAPPQNLPEPVTGIIIPDEIFPDRAHPDIRIARRALTIALLAKNISERRVSTGLRRTLMTQTRRLDELAQRRFMALGAEVEFENDEGTVDEPGALFEA